MREEDTKELPRRVQTTAAQCQRTHAAPTVVVRQVEQHADDGPHAVLHCAAHVARHTLLRQRLAVRDTHAVLSTVILLDQLLTVLQSSEGNTGCGLL